MGQLISFLVTKINPLMLDVLAVINTLMFDGLKGLNRFLYDRAQKNKKEKRAKKTELIQNKMF